MVLEAPGELPIYFGNFKGRWGAAAREHVSEVRVNTMPRHFQKMYNANAIIQESRPNIYKAVSLVVGYSCSLCKGSYLFIPFYYTVLDSAETRILIAHPPLLCNLISDSPDVRDHGKAVAAKADSGTDVDLCIASNSGATN